MKIVVYSENNYGCGASIAAYRLAKGLSKEHDVLFVFEKNKAKYNVFEGVDFRVWQLGESKNRLKQTVFKSLNITSRATRANVDRQFLFNLFYKKMKKLKPDVIHLHNVYFTHRQISRLSEEFSVVWTMHDQFAIHLHNYKIRTFHGVEKVYSPIPTWRKRFYELEILLNNKGSNIVFASPSTWLANLSNKIVQDRKPIEVVNNGIDITEFSSVPKHIAKERMQIETNKFTLLFLAGTGAWERKNSIVIFEALRLIPDLDVQVLAIGSVTKFDYDDSRVIKRGAVYSSEALRDVYSCADVFCIPSVLDNLPNTVIESLLCGTPVLGADAGGIPEMIEEGRTGWLFDPHSAEDLARHIVMLAEEYDPSKDLQTICRKSAVEQFSEVTMIQNYINIYNKSKNGER